MDQIPGLVRALPPGVPDYQCVYIYKLVFFPTVIALHGDNPDSSNPNQKAPCLLNTFAWPELRICIPCMYISIATIERETKDTKRKKEKIGEDMSDIN